MGNIKSSAIFCTSQRPAFAGLRTNAKPLSVLSSVTPQNLFSHSTLRKLYELNFIVIQEYLDTEERSSWVKYFIGLISIYVISDYVFCESWASWRTSKTVVISVM